MEYERQIFRVHQKMIKGKKCESFMNSCSFVLLLFSLFGTMYVAFSHFLYYNGTGSISAAFEEYKKIQEKDFFPALRYDDTEKTRKEFVNVNATQSMEWDRIPTKEDLKSTIIFF